MVTGARRKSMTTYQEINSAARSTQDEIKVRYTAKTHTSGGRRGGVSNSDDGRLDVKFSAPGVPGAGTDPRSEEHTSELQSRSDLVCRLLLEKKKKKNIHLILMKKTKNNTKK